jgi:ATP-binding cassette, subfamily B, bacterial
MNTAQSQPTIPTWKMNLQMIRWQWRPYTLHFIFAILIFAEQLVPGLIVKAIFDRLSGQSLPADPQPFGLNSLWWFIILYLLIEVLRIFVAIGYEWFGMTFRLLNTALLRSNLFASILRRPSDQPLPVSSGEALNRFHYHADIGEVTDFPTWIPDQVGKWIAATIAIVIMARINLPITLVIFLPLFGTIFISRLFWGRLLATYRAGRTALDAATGFLGEAFGTVQAIKIAGAEEGIALHMAQLNQNRRQIELRTSLFRGLLTALNSSVVNFSIGVILLMAGTAIAQNTFTIGDFALFVSYLWFTTQVPSEIGTFYGDYKTQAVSIERMLELIRPQPVSVLTENRPTYASGPLPKVPSPVKGPADRLETLSVRALTYHYPASENGSVSTNAQTSGQPRGIEGVNLSIQRGDFVVITGRIGSGKSTLLRTLLGLLSPQSGEIAWNGQPIPDPAAFFRPPRSSYTTQVPRLFSDTLRENILLGLSEEAVDLRAAIDLAVLQDDISALEKGLDTLVGPRGVRLSGGQVQRAAAARMLVRDPELLVFDDLSSALDVETEAQFWQRLDQQRRQKSDGVTCLVVSHRRAVLSKANWILVLKDGKVEAEGKLADLLITSDEMRRLWNGEVE